MSVPLPLWGDASASHSVQGRGEVQSIASVSSEWRTSLDFAQQLDIKAEKELHALWSALWAATHSEAALQTALESRRASWNPYRPVRGGPEVKAEILHSEVVEFQAMVPTDSLYLRGVAAQLPASSSAGSVSPRNSISRISNSWVSPVSPHGTGGQRNAAKSKADAEEEVLVMDGPSAVAFRSPSTPVTSLTRGSPWWAVRRAESEAALFHYMWEAVVVPYYASMPAAFFSAALPGDGAATQSSGSLMPFAPRREEREDREASGVVTAFGATREKVRKWSFEACRRSSSPSSANMSPAQKRDPSSVGGARFSTLATVRPPRLGSGGVSHVVASRDLDIVSEDSLEVEVLEENKGSSPVSPTHAASPLGKGSDRSAATPDPAAAPAERSGQRKQRPSSACVHVLTTAPLDVVATDKLPQGSTHASTSTTQQRAASAFSECVQVAGTLSAPRSGAAASAWMRGGLSGKASSRREVPLFHTTAKAAGKPSKTSSSSPPRVAAQPPPSRVQPQAAEGERAASPVSVVAAAKDHKSPQRVHPASGASRARGGRATASAVRGKASPAARSASRTASLAPISHADRTTVSPTTSTNASAQHALQLLDLHSRHTVRSPMLQRHLSPIPKAARETEGGKSAKAELTPPEVPASHSQRCGFVSPMQLPCRSNRRRHAEQLKRLVEPGIDAQVGFDLPETILANSQPGPPREVAAHSASTERHRPTAPNSRSVANTTASPAVRNSSIGARQTAKAPQRSSSKAKATSAAPKRPTTAHR
ncbi:conserved hypothetical protein [Leishmania major strain Friedlin]|uniref:Uncharacterized protein n=1 Tax=Leishmania major TaxID=5664 RepID=Q4Q0E6_LEIMA|nr:conserved hypothetical protein [Leishmania major strain Friedlin]CAG9584170.1 hypothetical_protein_-_conserved [Leishmania major strain Friedlin]CAJ09589.1 conserved hypothetical protein [Leishmania major strain Friedlin]|eukprot:XP_001687202.1 conserved hypothetical protein [Leishmania major strain Friedlin]